MINCKDYQKKLPVQINLGVGTKPTNMRTNRLKTKIEQIYLRVNTRGRVCLGIPRNGMQRDGEEIHGVAVAGIGVAQPNHPPAQPTPPNSSKIEKTPEKWGVDSEETKSVPGESGGGGRARPLRRAGRGSAPRRRRRRRWGDRRGPRRRLGDGRRSGGALVACRRRLLRGDGGI